MPGPLPPPLLVDKYSAGAVWSHSRRRAHAVLRFAKPRGENWRAVRHAGDPLRGMPDAGFMGMVALEVRSYTLARLRKEEQP